MKRKYKFIDDFREKNKAFISNNSQMLKSQRQQRRKDDRVSQYKKQIKLLSDEDELALKN
jgi:hypothetical protein